MSASNAIFDEWNEEKKVIHVAVKRNFPIHHREVRYVKLGINIGYEQNGKSAFLRPVLVLSKVGSMWFCLPLTTKGKYNKRYHHINSIDFRKSSAVILSQARTLDRARFIRQIATLPAQEFF
ncbi:type II toxin-antitoxin system PemK/MazF family toxin [Patescibacteria group bacterium]|nr:type II toxin-antitoxin system PemK/MazF family toxin [Patescibacteria group bacterium]